MTKKTKLGLSIASTALAVSLITGGSYALFSANAVNGNNTFTAGTVRIADFTGQSVASKMLNFNNLAPGDSDTKKITIKNTGSLDAWVRIDDTATQASRSGELFNGPKPLKISYSGTPVRVDAGQSVDLDVTYAFPIDADDSYQNATGSINVVVEAVQVRNNMTGAGTPNWFPSPQTYITTEDFNVTGGFTWNDVREHKGYSFGWHFAESPKTAGLDSVTVSIYKDNQLLQTNTGKSALLNSTLVQFSSPFEYTYKGNDAARFKDTFWNFGDWQGDSTDQPTKVVITVTTADGHTYTATKAAY